MLEVERYEKKHVVLAGRKTRDKKATAQNGEQHFVKFLLFFVSAITNWVDNIQELSRIGERQKLISIALCLTKNLPSAFV